MIICHLKRQFVTNKNMYKLQLTERSKQVIRSVQTNLMVIFRIQHFLL